LPTAGPNKVNWMSEMHARTKYKSRCLKSNLDLLNLIVVALLLVERPGEPESCAWHMKP